MSDDIQNDDRVAGFGIIHRSLRGRITAYEIAVYVALTWRADERGVCWLRHKRLAEESGCSISKVQQTLLSLRDKGLVTWVPRYGSDGGVMCNTYTVLILAGGSSSHGRGVGTPKRGGRSDIPTEVTTKNETPGSKRSPVADAQDDLLPELIVEDVEPVDRFDEWYGMYPRQVAPLAARRAWDKAVKDTQPEVIIEGLRRQRLALSTQERQFIKHPSTWLNGGCWADDPVAILSPSGNPWLDLERVDALTAMRDSGYTGIEPARHEETP